MASKFSSGGNNQPSSGGGGNSDNFLKKKWIGPNGMPINSNGQSAPHLAILFDFT